MRATKEGGVKGHYVRDASGNVMGIYKNDSLSEVPIYGSARLGQYMGKQKQGEGTMGLRRYELTNHLGNVLTVISDKVGMKADSVWATVLSASDYYPFGLEMKGRTWTDSTYRYGFNGKETDIETGYTDYGFRLMDRVTGRFLTPDPLTKKYPELTPYQFASNTPIQAIDLDGLEAKAVNKITDNFKGMEGYKITFERATAESVIYINFYNGANVRNATGVSHIPETHDVNFDVVTGSFTTYSIGLNSSGEITSVAKMNFEQSGSRSFPETMIGEGLNLTEIYDIKNIQKEFSFSNLKIDPNKLNATELINGDPLTNIVTNPLVKAYSNLVKERSDLLRNNDVPYLSTGNKVEEFIGNAIEFSTEVIPGDIVHYNGSTIMDIPFKNETKATQEIKKSAGSPKTKQ